MEGTLTHFLPQDGIYVYFRKFKEELVMVLLNNNTSDKHVSVDRFYEVLEDKTTGISALKKQIYDLKTDIHVPSKTALVLNVQ